MTPERENKILAQAARILEERAKYGDALGSPKAVRDYLRVTMEPLEREAFTCVWLTAQHNVTGFERLFEGTISQSSVYPREVVKAALRTNAAAVIFAHNHPSGDAAPSHADIVLTGVLKQALALVDVGVLDHLVVGARQIASFAEMGLL